MSEQHAQGADAVVDLNNELKTRREKLANLREQGIAFPNDFRRDHTSDQLHAEFDGKENEELEALNIEVAVAGRMMTRRIMGKASFVTLQDVGGRIQLYVARDDLPEGVYNEQFKKWDLGDILGAKGKLFKTKTGKKGGIEAAKEVCRNKRGPVASIFYQGLDRYNQGLDSVEKAVVSYGSVQTGRMESGLSWIGLFIALSPMLGFMGTVVGMIEAFDAIQAAGDISPTLVAGGIKVALLTTLLGLIAAVILQLFYNYIVSKIDSLVNDMEDSSITLMDILTAYKK